MNITRSLVNVLRYDAVCYSVPAAEEFEEFLRDHSSVMSVSRSKTQVTFYSLEPTGGTIADDWERDWVQRQIDAKRAKKQTAAG